MPPLTRLQRQKISHARELRIASTCWIASLPPELLDSILMLLASDNKHDLPACARVCKSWTPGARRAMCWSVKLRSQAEAVLFLGGTEVGVNAKFCRGLEVEGLEAKTLKEVLGVCGEGRIKRLSLKACEETEYELLSAPSLSRLTHLHLDSRLARPVSTSPSPAIAPMIILEIGHNAHATIGPLRPLFTSLAPSLRELKLELWHIGTTYAWEKVLPIVKSSLTSLYLGCRLTDDFSALLTDFPNLTHFGFDRRNVDPGMQSIRAVLRTLKCPKLYHLHVSGPPDTSMGNLEILARAIEDGLAPFDKIKEIKVGEGSGGENVEEGTWQFLGLRSACRQKGTSLDLPPAMAWYDRRSRSDAWRYNY